MLRRHLFSSALLLAGAAPATVPSSSPSSLSSSFRFVASSHNKMKPWANTGKKGGSLNQSSSKSTFSLEGKQRIDEAFKKLIENDSNASSPSSPTATPISPTNNTIKTAAKKLIELTMNPENDTFFANRDKSRSLAPRGIPHAPAWWSDTNVLRKNRFARLNSGIAVVGGSEVIKEMIQNENCALPRCVFVPDDEPTPEWLTTLPAKRQQQQQQPEFETKNNSNNNNHPIVVVRAPRARINHDLLSAEKCDGYAAQVYLPKRLPREYAFVSSSEDHNVGEKEETTRNKKDYFLDRVAVCHGLRIPGNVGAIIRSAYKSGFDGIVLDRCCELTAEKVLRAAGEAALDPNFHIFEFGHKLIPTQQQEEKQQQEMNGGRSEAEKDFAEGASSGLLLKRIAAAHNLLPMVVIPSPSTPFASSEEVGVYDVMTVARQYHYSKYINEKRDEFLNNNNKSTDNNKTEEQDNENNNSNRKSSSSSSSSSMGTMIVVGGEAQGLTGLASEWNRDALFVPLIPICLKIDNSFINSVNVAATASTAMYYFRPNAGKEFGEYFKRGIVPDIAAENEMDPEEEDVAAALKLAKLTDSRYILPVLNEAKEYSERLLK